jgi:hypothetical protein
MSYDFWRGELANPTPPERRLDRPTDPAVLSGFYRLNAARTKIDWPVAIWTSEAGDHFYSVGGKTRNCQLESESWERFLAASWLKCTAVSEEDFRKAIETKLWPDGKEALRLTDEERLALSIERAAKAVDPIPEATDSTGRGTNYDPSLVDDEPDEQAEPSTDDEPRDLEHERIKAGLEILRGQWDKFGPVDSIERANAAAAILEPMRRLGSEGERLRKEERKPFDDAIAAVQAKWLPVLKPASETVDTIRNSIDAFQRRELARKLREEEERRQAEARRLTEEKAARLREEEAERQRLAAAYGQPAEPAKTEDEIEAEAAEAAEREVAERPPPRIEKPRVGTAYGRAVSVAKRRRGEITDRAAFIAAIDEHPDFEEWLKDKANKLARARVRVAGMQIIEE